MKQIEKQSMRDLIKFALEMPVGDLAKYGTLFLSGPVPEKMTRGELIALQLVERASYGDLDAVKEIRSWIHEDPNKPSIAGGSNYYQFLIQISNGGKVPDVLPEDAAQNLRKLAKTIELAPNTVETSPVLNDLLS